MWRWCAYLFGVVLIAVALVAVPSAMIVESYVGGSAVHGSVEDGRYFVNPGHNQPIVEVSESEWQTLYWVQQFWPWSALVPAWVGIILTVSGMGPNWKPVQVPPGELPPWMIRACGLAGCIPVAGALLTWVMFRVPWVAMLVGWILFCVSTGIVTWTYSRSLRQQATAKPDAARME